MDQWCFQEILVHEIDRLPCTHCGEQCLKYVAKHGYDVYGQKIDNHDANGELAECPICKKSVAASRFAPHLEKCLGMGRSARPKRSNIAVCKTSEVSDPTSFQLEITVDKGRPSDQSGDEEAYKEPESKFKSVLTHPLFCSINVLGRRKSVSTE